MFSIHNFSFVRNIHIFNGCLHFWTFPTFWHWWSLVDEFYYTFFSSSPCNRERWTRAEKVNWFRETTWKIYGMLKVLIFFSMFLTHSTPFFSFLKVKDHVAVKCKMITRRKIYNFLVIKLSTFYFIKIGNDRNLNNKIFSNLYN